MASFTMNDGTKSYCRTRGKISESILNNLRYPHLGNQTFKEIAAKFRAKEANSADADSDSDDEGSSSNGEDSHEEEEQHFMDHFTQFFRNTRTD